MSKKTFTQKLEKLLSDPAVLDAVVKDIPMPEIARPAVTDEARRILLLALSKRAYVDANETGRRNVVVMQILPAERLREWHQSLKKPANLAPVPRAVTVMLQKAGATLEVVRLDTHRIEDRYELVIDPITDRL